MTADVKIDTFTLLINLYFSIEYIILLLSLHHPGPQIRKCINIWNKERVRLIEKWTMRITSKESLVPWVSQ